MKKLLALLLVFVTVLLSGCVKMEFDNNVNALEQQETTSTEVATESTNEDKKLLAITFDDGPCANTQRVLDILAKYDSKATFFVLGNRIKGNEDTIKRIVDDGHDIGSHTWAHKNLTKLTDDKVQKQLKTTKNKIHKITGYDSPYIRPPYGEWNKKVRKYSKKDGLSIIKWNVDTLDWETKNKKKIAKNIVNNANDGRIILCHDLYDATVDALEIAIPKLIEQGYELVTVTDLLTSDGGKILPGAVYYNRYEVE